MKYANLAHDKTIGSYQWNHQALLGSGAFGKVYLGKDTKNNNQFVAIKVLENSQMKDKYLQQSLKNEIAILQKLKGPNVVGLYDFVQTEEQAFIIQMFCNGGDFRSYLTKKQKIPEPEAKHILRDLLKGFQELYNFKLIHRDLKPENILINDNIFKLADFGFGRSINSGDQMLQSFVGTPLYMSPQIIQALPYTSKSDIWSMGIIYYEMLFGTTPWPCNSQFDLVEKMLKTPISQESQSFIQGCLQVEEKDRLSWEQIFQHPIFQENVQQIEHVEKKQISPTCIQMIKQIQEFLQEKNIEMEIVFKKLDRSEDNQLDIEEFGRFLLYLNPQLQQQDIQEFFQNFADKNTQTVDYKTFERILTQYNFDQQQQPNKMLDIYRADKLLKKLIDKIVTNNVNLERLFKQTDQSGDNLIDFQEFTALLLKIDDSLLPQEADHIFKKFDQVRNLLFLYCIAKAKSGQLTFDQFKNAIYGGVEKQGGDPYEKKEYGKMPSELPTQVQNIVRLLKKVIVQHNLDIKIIFQNFDQDKSQNLSFEEFSKFLRVINAQLTDNDIDVIFQSFDQNKNNLIELADIEAMLTTQ